MLKCLLWLSCVEFVRTLAHPSVSFFGGTSVNNSVTRSFLEVEMKVSSLTASTLYF